MLEVARREGTNWVKADREFIAGAQHEMYLCHTHDSRRRNACWRRRGGRAPAG